VIIIGYYYSGTAGTCTRKLNRAPKYGDPLAPILFCLVFKKVINIVSERCALNFNIWFWDDGVILGPAEEASRIFEIIEQDGLTLASPKKTEVSSE
jgi:hypothetical protein